MHLVYRLREHAPERGEDWVIEVSDETGARPLVVLPRAVPMLREARTPAEFVIPVHAGIQRAKRKM